MTLIFLTFSLSNLNPLFSKKEKWRQNPRCETAFRVFRQPQASVIQFTKSLAYQRTLFRKKNQTMSYRIIVFLALICQLVSAGDNPLPFSNLSAVSTGQGAFSNPAASALGSGPELGLTSTNWETSDGLTERLLTAQYQGDQHAEGLRYYLGTNTYQARFDLALATNWINLFSPGIRLSYLSSGSESDHALLDGGLDFRPCPQLLIGYYGENLWSGGIEKPVQNLGISVRPWGSRSNWLADFQIGLSASRSKSMGRSGFLFTQIPIYGGLRMQNQWDPKHKEGAIALVLQATGQWSAGLGISRSTRVPNSNSSLAVDPDAQKLRRHTASIGYRFDQRTPFLFGTGKVAEINLNTTIAEGHTNATFLGSQVETGFMDLQERFSAIEANPKISSVIIKLGKAHCGWAMGEEIRRNIISLRNHGKRVVAYMEQVTPLNYFLASATDLIALQPEGYFAVSGFSAEVTFFRGFFDKVGVEPQFLRHGKFKSFEEPYMRTSFSEPARADLSEYLGSLWDHYLDVVSQARKLSKDSLRRALESGEISLAHAKRAGLIDTLIQADQVLQLAGGPKAKTEMSTAERPYRFDWNIPPRIAVVIVTGDMVLGNSSRGWMAGPDLAGATTVASQLRRARLTPGVRAIVLRVDSPGGSAQAADIMAREVALIKEAHIPIVASVGHNAASGGYYLICGADRILAEPNSTVGSIGVLWGKFVLKGLYEKLGLNVESVKTSPHSDGNTMTRTWDSTEVEILQRHMDQFYTDFVARVALGRHKTKPYIDSLGQGRIFTGTQALQNGLIDTLGGLGDAVALAGKLSGLKTGRHFEVTTIEAGNEDLGLSTVGRDWARAPTGIALIEDQLTRIQNLAKPSLWAISPELAGWLGAAGPSLE
jgi:protease IV